MAAATDSVDSATEDERANEGERSDGAVSSNEEADHPDSDSAILNDISESELKTKPEVPNHAQIESTTPQSEPEREIKRPSPAESFAELPPKDEGPAPRPSVAEKMAPKSSRKPYEVPPPSSIHKLHRFSLYETSARYFITGADITDKYYKVLKIDRTAPPGHLTIFEDDIVYSKQQLTQLLTAIDDGNKATGGLRIKFSFWGLLGFIRFTEAYYMLLITKRQQVAMIGGHYIYQIEGTELVPLTTGASTRFARDRNPEEARFLGIFNNLDLSKSFYFSYSYNITRTLQHTIIQESSAVKHNDRKPAHDFNDMFVWNHHLLRPAAEALNNAYDWCLPVIHGFIDQSALDVFGRLIYITIIGRRSRVFAGARFLKRGANDLGYVANDVETEQIVSELLTTSFHAPGPRLFSNPTYTSYVHHRGSIPLYWTQDNSGVTPKPDIDVNLTDPFYQPAALHFDNLFERYGCPIYVLNLIKARERTPRESKLLHEFKYSIDYLNQFLPDDKKIFYKAFDMSRASKTRGGDVIGTLEIIAEEIMQKTGFFHNGIAEDGVSQVQNGVARTNCIDCLDRTNAAQFVIGKRAFGHQLKALGVISTPDMEYDSDAINIFTHMFHDHGDTIAVQYGGSHLVNTMATYRKVNHWQSQSRDMVESFKRYYHNSFLDSQRQEAYNLFLGNYIWAQGQPMLWDLSTDYYLHHSDPKAYLDRTRRSYIQWFTPEHLVTRKLPPPPERHVHEQQKELGIEDYDDYWLEYYRPLAVSSFLKIYSYRINSTNRYLSDRPNKDGKFDFSPFVPRLDPYRQAPESPEKKPIRKEVTIVDPNSENDHRAGDSYKPRPRHNGSNETHPGILHHAHHSADYKSPEQLDQEAKAADKTLMTQWTLNQFHTNSLNPSVSATERDEYERYISHPLNLPLVVTNDLQPSDSVASLDFVDYVNSGLGTYDGEGSAPWDVTEADLEDFADFLETGAREDALSVDAEDGGKKRYKAYRQWLVKGKSLFKQSKVDPEYRPDGVIG